MFRVLHNRARLRLEIEPVTPLLIKAGGEGGLDPTLPQLQFVRTHTDVGPSFVIPGGSLKGVVRSQAERILRSVEASRACDPLDRNSPCRQGRGLPGPQAYRQNCHACRTFGSTTLASRARFTDALPWSPDMDPAARAAALGSIRTEVRSGVAIDRQSQSARRGQLFELEVVSAGRFHTEVFLTNFQLWQLALVGLSLRDLDQGYQQLGMGKTRGLGRVRCRVTLSSLEFFGPLAAGDRLRGVGVVPDYAETYGTTPDDECEFPPGGEVEPALGLRVVLKGEEAWDSFLSTLVSSPGCRVLRKEEGANAGGR